MGVVWVDDFLVGVLEAYSTPPTIMPITTSDMTRTTVSWGEEAVVGLESPPPVVVLTAVEALTVVAVTVVVVTEVAVIVVAVTEVAVTEVAVTVVGLAVGL